MADYFLKIDGVAGDSLDAHHRDEIDVIAFAWGETNSGSSSSGSGAGSRRVVMEDFHFTALTGSASPRLMLLCANGKHVRRQCWWPVVPGSRCRNTSRSRSVTSSVGVPPQWIGR